ncbi:MAG: helix-turn-helix domain-containing protein [Pseudomonadota bacterium]
MSTETAAAQRRANILESAVHTFAELGFRRSAMEDIAAAAGISRPALYQYFRNKAEVFRAASEHIQTTALNEAKRALAAMPDAPLAGQLAAVLITYKLPAWRIVATTPHGSDLLTLNEDLAEDVTMAARAAALDLLVAALAPQIASGWDADTAARLLLDASWTAVSAAPSEDAFRTDLSELAALWANALTRARPG